MNGPVTESARDGTPAEPKEGAGAKLQIRLLGTLSIRRDGAALALPGSRKVRALIAYLSLAPHPVTRSQLCELLWDIPNDPRGELRWCLSKIRIILDEPGRRRVETHDDRVWLDLSDCFVDAAEVERSVRAGVGTLAPDRLQALQPLFNGDLVDGLEVERNPAFTSWLVAQRRHFRDIHVALLERLARELPDEEAQGPLDIWLQQAPFDPRPHEALLRVLARQGRIREGEQHVTAAIRLFEAEGLGGRVLQELWRKARAEAEARPRPQAASPAANLPAERPDEAAPSAARRASVAVMPFADLSAGPQAVGGPADGLVYDVITRLAKLRGLFVIAQGTVFALRDQSVAPAEAGRVLGVDYVVSGSMQRHGQRLVVAVELVEPKTARIVWAEVFDHAADDLFLVLEELGNRIVASVDSEVEAAERNRAILKPPNSLNAWEAHHRGLWHMYRFNRPDNDLARHCFETALRLDPTFARAHAGLSFTYWQDAFQGWTDRGTAADLAYESAGQSLMADDRDPTSHWAMGRALWLRGRHDQSVTELEQAVALSPNFALGHYCLAFVQSLSGDAGAAIVAADHSRHLSPFDPLLFGMLGSRSMALARLGRYEEAAEWGLKAAARPNAHTHILAIAALTLSLAGRTEEARISLASIRTAQPSYGIEDFLTAMQFDSHGQEVFRLSAKRIGLI